MEQKSIATSLAPDVLVETVEGSLQVKGWDRPEVMLKAPDGDFELVENDDTVRLHCSSDCVLRVPHAAALEVHAVNGEAYFKLLEEPLSIQKVAGSLRLNDVSDVQIETVAGNLHARRVQGDLEIDRVGGNAGVRQVEGSCNLSQVGGNLELRDIEGDLEAEAGGNVRLRLSHAVALSYELQAGGHLECRLPESADLRVSLESGGERIRVRLPEGTKTYEREAAFELGSGAGTLEARAGGTVDFRAYGSEWGAEENDEVFVEDMGRQISEQIESQMDQLSEQLSQLSNVFESSGFSSEQAERIARKARQAGERAAARAQEQLQRHMDRVQRHAERAGRGRKVSYQGSAPEPKGPSDEERLMILQMLEQKKITLQQAQELLDALEGEG